MSTEGATDEVVLRAVLRYAHLEPGNEYCRGRGREHIRSALAHYNLAARYAPWAVLVDLDRYPGCVGSFVEEWLPAPAPCMRFRVAVRAIEAWLLADRQGLGEFLHVRPDRVPPEPDSLPNPKRAMVDLASRSSSVAVRRDMLPREGSGSAVGAGYATRLQQFVLEERWRIDAASEASESLRRTVAAFATLARCNGTARS
jgi:hypothetical protein